MLADPGLDRTAIRILDAEMDHFVSHGDIPGIVMLVSRGPDTHVHVVGNRTTAGGDPIARDSIFRIASLTKPITAAATAILIDSKRFRMDTEIDEWLPELANRRVLRSIGAELDDTVPAQRAITVGDLLTFCMGFGSVMAPPGTYPIQRPIADGHLGGDGPPHPALTPFADEWIRRLGALPLMYQPGERWLYNTGSDVLGVLIARVSGMSFESFMQERLFGPLGMKDTGFSVPPEKRTRLCGCYRFDHEAGALRVFDGVESSEYLEPPAFESGAGGLVSTLDDYAAFCRMMLGGGWFQGKRVLSSDAVEPMTRDQLTDGQRRGAEIFFGRHTSWGLGMAVNIDREEIWQIPGRFGWDGGFGTTAWCDPRNHAVGILLTQRLMDSPQPPPVFREFWKGVQRAIE